MRRDRRCWCAGCGQGLHDVRKAFMWRCRSRAPPSRPPAGAGRATRMPRRRGRTGKSVRAGRRPTRGRCRAGWWPRRGRGGGPTGARAGSACPTRRSTRSATVGCGGTPRRAAGSPRRPGKKPAATTVAPNPAAARAPCSPRSVPEASIATSTPRPALRSRICRPTGSSAVGSTTSVAPNFMASSRRPGSGSTA